PWIDGDRHAGLHEGETVDVDPAALDPVLAGADLSGDGCAGRPALAPWPGSRIGHAGGRAHALAERVQGRSPGESVLKRHHVGHADDVAVGHVDVAAGGAPGTAA